MSFGLWVAVVVVLCVRCPDSTALASDARAEIESATSTLQVLRAGIQIDAETSHSFSAALIRLQWPGTVSVQLEIAANTSSSPSNNATCPPRANGLVRLQCGIDIADSLDLSAGAACVSTNPTRSVLQAVPAGSKACRSSEALARSPTADANNESNCLPPPLLDVFGIRHLDLAPNELAWLLPLSHSTQRATSTSPIFLQRSPFVDVLASASWNGQNATPANTHPLKCQMWVLPPDQQPRVGGSQFKPPLLRVVDTATHRVLNDGSPRTTEVVPVQLAQCRSGIDAFRRTPLSIPDVSSATRVYRFLERLAQYNHDSLSSSFIEQAASPGGQLQSEQQLRRHEPNLLVPADQERVTVPRTSNVLTNVVAICDRCILGCNGTTSSTCAGFRCVRACCLSCPEPFVLGWW